MAAFRKIRHRIRLSPSLSSQRMNVGDMVLVMPDDFASTILDSFTCWSVCDGDYNQLNTFEARTFRNNLQGGLYGAGRIFIDGFEIPIMPYDWGLINSASTFDMYLQGQFNDMSKAAAVRSDRYSTDGGRLLTWRVDDHTCEQQIVEMQPRLLMWGPWAQARFQNISSAIPGGVMSADPWSDLFPYP